MPDRDALIAIVQAAYAAFSAREPQQLLPLCTSDCEWQAPGLPGFMPWAGEHHGHAGVLEFIALLDQHLEFQRFSLQACVVDVHQQRVVALGTAHCRVKASGKEYVNHWAHLFGLRAGLVCSFREYPDTAAQLAAIHPALYSAATAEENRP